MTGGPIGGAKYLGGEFSMTVLTSSLIGSKLKAALDPSPEPTAIDSALDSSYLRGSSLLV